MMTGFRRRAEKTVNERNLPVEPLDVCDLAWTLALPALNAPFRMPGCPFGDFRLTKDHALLRCERLGHVSQMDVLAALRITNEADRNKNLDHGCTPSSCWARG